MTYNNICNGFTEAGTTNIYIFYLSGEIIVST